MMVGMESVGSGHGSLLFLVASHSRPLSLTGVTFWTRLLVVLVGLCVFMLSTLGGSVRFGGNTAVLRLGALGRSGMSGDVSDVWDHKTMGIYELLYYEYDVCDSVVRNASFMDVSDVWDHQMMGIDELLYYEYDVCDSVVRKASFMGFHQMIQIGELSYECSVGECLFIHAIHYVKVEYLFIHSVTNPFCELFQLRCIVIDDRPYRCKKCVINFSHKDIQASYRPCECDICLCFSFSSVTVEYLNISILLKVEYVLIPCVTDSFYGLLQLRFIHTDVQPYKCDKCDITFKHNISQASELPYECDNSVYFYTDLFFDLFERRFIHIDNWLYKNCEKCQITFNRKHIHASDRTYECD